MAAENLVIIIVMAVYLLFMLWLGFFFKNRVKSLDDFILGGRGLPWFVITMTLLATLANAQQVLGIAGFSYQTGLSFMIWFFITVNIFIYPMMKRLGTRYRGMNFSTIVDLAEERYPGSGRLTLLLSVFQVAWAVFSTGICFFGGAITIQTVFKVDWLLAIAITGVITVAYCMMGGLRAVVFTDVIQWVIIVLGTALFVPIVFIRHGSFTAFFSDLLGPAGMAANEGAGLWAGFSDLFTLPPGGFITVAGIIAMGIAGSLWMPVDLGFMQRMLAAKDTAQARRSALFFIIVVTIWASIMVAMGMYARVLYPNVSVADTVVILLARGVLPVIGAALFITAVAAAVMSTVSTYLNAGAAILAKNVYQRFIRPNQADRQYLLVARVATLLIALAAMAFAPMVRTGGVFVTALTIQMVICSALAPMIVLSTYWKRMSERAAFWGTLVSGVVTTWLTIRVGGGGAAFAGAGLWGIPVVVLGLIISVVIFVVLSLLERYDPQRVGPQFRTLFEGGSKELRTSPTDLIVIGGIVAFILIVLLVRSLLKGPLGAFPPLSGPLAFLTNGYFILAAAFVAVLCFLILAWSIGWLRGMRREVEKKVRREPSPGKGAAEGT
jgi:solute:Na+ symporter, SSS family